MDVETANARMSSICQIGAVLFLDGVEILQQSWLIDPEDDFDDVNIGIHGIDETKVKDAPTLPEFYPKINEWTKNQIVICHTHFDRVAFAQACAFHSLPSLDCEWLDTARVARRAWPQFARRGYGLANVAEHCGIQFKHHDALEDARAAALILLRAVTESGTSITDWITRCKIPLTPQTAIRRTGDGDGSLVGEVIVFTGALQMLRRDAADRAARAGADVEPDVNKHTTLLVVGDQDIDKLNGRDRSLKQLKAERLMAKGKSLRIIGETDFMALSA